MLGNAAYEDMCGDLYSRCVLNDRHSRCINEDKKVNNECETCSVILRTNPYRQKELLEEYSDYILCKDCYGEGKQCNMYKRCKDFENNKK